MYRYYLIFLKPKIIESHMSKVVIDLENYRVFDSETKLKSRVFAGRPRGEKVRDSSKIDELVENNDFVEVVVPDDIRALNPSFIEEFLYNVVKKYGPNGFREKVTFTSPGGFKFESKLQEGVSRIMRRMSGLDS